MLIGVTLPPSGRLTAPATMVRLAVEAEALGFAFASVSDHVVIPTSIDPAYPYSESGDFPGGAARGEWHEQLTTVAFLAAKTARLRFHTSVMVVPYRPAVLTAKMLATIDLFSAGRLSVGCGTGWMREEFEALDAPRFEERGAVTDEWLAAFHALWTEPRPRYDGRHVRFHDLAFAPKPVQRPHPPLWIGGESGPALRRAARLGDGWYPIGSNPRHPLDTLGRWGAAVEKLRRLVAAEGREPGSVRLGYRVPRQPFAAPSPADTGERRLFTGAVAEVLGDLRSARDLGLDMIEFNLLASTEEGTLERMRRFAGEVIAGL
jgi:probable F420-dependent oxidoreductase